MTIEGVPETNILAVLLILAAALILGIFARLPFGAAVGQYLEQRTLNRLPVYRPLKTLLYALLGSEQSQSFKPAFIVSDSGVGLSSLLPDVPDIPEELKVKQDRS